MTNNYNLNEKAIAEAAYFIWKNNGCPMNTSTQDWYAAINQLKSLNTKKTSLSSKTLLSSLTGKKTSACKTTTASKKSPAKKLAKKSK